MSNFSQFKLIEPLKKAIKEAGYDTPTPIQEGSIPPLLEQRDLLGIAQTGTGKTAAFVLPILNHLQENPRRLGSYCCRCLILTPTRELALQIEKSIGKYGKYVDPTSTVIFGGVGSNPQMKAMQKGRDLVVATPGRLLDLMKQKKVVLDQVEVFVLDEADRMLDMGFLRDVRKIINALPKKKQTLLFSATMPKDIAELANSLLKDPVKVAVTPESTTVEKIDQRIYFVDKKNKINLLKHLVTENKLHQVLVFTRTKHGANKVSQDLVKAGVESAAIHGNKSQSARVAALEGFKKQKIRVLVATDIAARGIDIPGLNYVFNYDLPEVPESYVHRIGRTARAGRSGAAFAFCDASEKGLLRQIERNIRMQVPIVDNHPFPATAGGAVEDAAEAAASRPGQRKRGGRFSRDRNGGGSKPAKKTDSANSASRPSRKKKFGPKKKTSQSGAGKQSTGRS